MVQVFPKVSSVEFSLLLRVGDTDNAGMNKDDNKSLSDSGKELSENMAYNNM